MSRLLGQIPADALSKPYIIRERSILIYEMKKVMKGSLK